MPLQKPAIYKTFDVPDAVYDIVRVVVYPFKDEATKMVNLEVEVALYKDISKDNKLESFGFNYTLAQADFTMAKLITKLKTEDMFNGSITVG